MPKSAKSTQSGSVISADANILPDAINALVTGEGVACNRKHATENHATENHLTFNIIQYPKSGENTLTYILPPKNSFHSFVGGRSRFKLLMTLSLSDVFLSGRNTELISVIVKNNVEIITRGRT